MYIPILRKKGNVVQEIKKIDPKSAITRCAIDKLISTKKISQIKYGNAWLINMDELYNYFYTKTKHKRKKK